MPLKIVHEEIAWMEEFGTLDQPVAARGAMVFTLRSVLMAAIGGILIYKGMTFGGPKIHQIVPVSGLILIAPGALLLLFGIIPSKSVRREIQFLFMLRLLVKRITSPSKKKQPKVPMKTNKVKLQHVQKKTITKGKKKKKAKPAPIIKK